MQTGVAATEIGKRFIDKAAEIMEKLGELDELADEYSSAASRQLSLACVPLFTPMLSESLELLMQNNPGAKIDISEKKSKEIMYDVLHNVIDIGFMVINPDLLNEPELKYDILLESDVYVCVNKKTPLASMKCLTPELLRNQSIVSYNCNIIDWLNYYFNDQSFQYSVATNNLDYMKQRIIHASAISIVPELVIQSNHFLASGEIEAIPLWLNDEVFKMQVVSVKLKKNKTNRLSRELLKKINVILHPDG